jgi:hypothetical protein
VERAPHGQGAYDLAALERREDIRASRALCAQSDSPERVGEVLRLDGEQMSDGLRHCADRGGVDSLGELTKSKQLARAHLDRHWFSMPLGSDLIGWTNST